MITSSHQDLVRALPGDKGNIRHNLHTLEARGLMVIGRSPGGKAASVWLTSEGQKGASQLAGSCDEGESPATRGRKVDCLASCLDQTCCSIHSILRGTAARSRAVKCPRTRSPQSPDWRPNREGTVSLPASGGEGAGWAVW
jgi:hypothetical protein